MRFNVSFFKKYIISTFLSAMIALSCGLFLLYGPFTAFRDFLITSAMTTLNHKWLATTFYNDDAINSVMHLNRVEDPVDTGVVITIKDELKEKMDPDDPFYREHDEAYKIIPISDTGYKGYIAVIYDKTKLKMGLSQYLGNWGERLSVGMQRDNALIAVNASGFVDVDGSGSGGQLDLLTIYEGEILYENKADSHRVIGLNADGDLNLLTVTTGQEALDLGIVYGVEFGPFLVKNGEPCTVYGNGGWGIAPRTAIGQREDGIIFFVVIDGRQPLYSDGISIKDLAELMVTYGAVNAANLDGGSSSALAEHGVLINKPSTPVGERLVPNWFMLLP